MGRKVTTFETVIAKLRNPDRNWKAFLWIVTSLDGLWAAVEPNLDFAHETAELSPGRYGFLSGGERRMLNLARSLFDGHGEVDVTDLADFLDDRTWRVILEALVIYRTNVLPAAHTAA